MEDFDFYPQKPDLVESKEGNNTASTVFSLLLFVATFLLLFQDQLELIIALVIVLIVHEFGHYAMMKKFNYKNVRMLFVPLMGAFVNGRKSEYSQKESFLVIGAGPFPGVFLGIALIFAAQQFNTPFLLYLGLMFLFLNILNLLPLDPLDGGQLFKLMIHKKQELFLLVFAFVSSIIMIGIGWYFQFYILMIFGFLMAFRVRTLQRNYQMHGDLDDDNVNFHTTYKNLSNRDFSKIKEVLLNYTPALRKYMDMAEEHEVNTILASQVNNILITPTKLDAGILFKIVIISCWIVSILSPIILYFSLDLKWVANALENGFSAW